MSPTVMCMSKSKNSLIFQSNVLFLANKTELKKLTPMDFWKLMMPKTFFKCCN